MRQVYKLSRSLVTHTVTGTCWHTVTNSVTDGHGRHFTSSVPRACCCRCASCSHPHSCDRHRRWYFTVSLFWASSTLCYVLSIVLLRITANVCLIVSASNLFTVSLFLLRIIIAIMMIMDSAFFGVWRFAQCVYIGVLYKDSLFLLMKPTHWITAGYDDDDCGQYCRPTHILELAR